MIESNLQMSNMIAPRRLLAIALQREQNWKYFLKYEKLIEKIVKCEQRVVFLGNCKKADIIPKFLKFRIPNNGCFDNDAVHAFQKKITTKGNSKVERKFKISKQSNQ